MSIRQLRDKYEQIVSLNPNRELSVRSQKSSTPSRQSQIQMNKSLLCGPCFNRRVIESSKQEKQAKANNDKQVQQFQINESVRQEYQQQHQNKLIQQQKKAQEEQFLKESLQESQKKTQIKLAEKQQQIEYEKYLAQKNKELDALELKIKHQKQLSLQQDLQKQMVSKKKPDKDLPIDDPQWRYISYEEKQQEMRKRQQEEFVNKNWSNYQTEKQKQLDRQRLEKSQEEINRVRTQDELSTKEREGKIIRKQKQQEMSKELRLQMKMKQDRINTQKLLEAQQQRQFDISVQNLESQRDRAERERQQKLTQQYQQSLKSYQKAQPIPKSYECNNILDRSASKQYIKCTDCRRDQEPQQLSVL